MSFFGCFVHGVELLHWTGLPPEANSYRDTCYLLWESLPSVWWLRGLRGAEWVLKSQRGLCSKGMNTNRLTHSLLQEGMELGPCHCLHLNNEEGHFLLGFSFCPSISPTVCIQLLSCSLFRLNNCMGIQGTEAESSWSSDKSNVLF